MTPKLWVILLIALMTFYAGIAHGERDRIEEKVDSIIGYLGVPVYLEDR